MLSQNLLLVELTKVSYIVAISTEQRKQSSIQCWSGDPTEAHQIFVGPG